MYIQIINTIVHQDDYGINRVLILFVLLRRINIQIVIVLSMKGYVDADVKSY
jgi:hypothetical protein